MSGINYVKTEPTNYITEIRRMMYGFGDSSEPLIESATIINDVVQSQMRNIVHEACKVADQRQSQIVEEQDFLFLLRHDKVKLNRLLNYLQFQRSVKKIFRDEPGDLPGTGDQSAKNVFEYFKEFLAIIESPTDKKVVDRDEERRKLRADMQSRTLDTANYLEYSRARSVSFANKYNHKFGSWIATEGDMKIATKAYSILGYFAYETVATIMDLAFMVRHDQTKIYGDSLERLKLSYCNPATYKPYHHGQGAVLKPVTPAEINEALRRFWSPQLDKIGPFNRRSAHKPHPKFLAL